MLNNTLKKLEKILYFIFTILMINNCSNNNKNNYFDIINMVSEIKINTTFQFNITYYSYFSQDQTATISIVKKDDDDNYIDYSTFGVTGGVGNENVHVSFYFSEDYNDVNEYYSVIIKADEGPTYKKTFQIVPNGNGGENTDVISFSNNIENEYIPEHIGYGSTSYGINIDIDIAKLIENNTVSNEDNITISASFVDDNQKEYEFNRVEYAVDDINFLTYLTVPLEFGWTVPYGFDNDVSSFDFKLMAKLSLVPFQYNQLYSSIIYDNDIKIYDLTVEDDNSLNLEYDCVNSADFLAESTYLEELNRALKTAFSVADIKINMAPENRNLEHNNYISEGELNEFAKYNDMDYSGSDINPHILFFRRLTDNDGNLLNKAGRSSMNLEFTGDNYRYSYVFLDGTNMDIHKFVINCIIHELGHQLAGLTHASGDNENPEEHKSPFCSMNQGLSYKYDGTDNDDNAANNDYNPTWTFSYNTHFCDKCLIKLNNNFNDNWR